MSQYSFNAVIKPLLRRNIFVAEKFTDYYAIGDTHGCLEEYADLLGLIRSESKSSGRPFFVFNLGDKIDRGPFFKEMFLDPKLEKPGVDIIGNHEYKFLMEHYGLAKCNSEARAVSHEKFALCSVKEQEEILRQIGESLNWASIRIGEREFIMSHAPLKEMETIPYASPQELIGWVNAQYCCFRSTEIDKFAVKNSRRVMTFLYGHQSWGYTDIKEQIASYPVEQRTQHYNLDSGCVYGGQLTALRLNDLVTFQVQSKVKVDKR